MNIEIPSHIAKQHAAMAECAMLSGELDKALAAVRRAFSEAAESAITLESGVDMVCSPRTTGLLVANGVRTIGDLTQRSVNELSEIPQLGWQSIEVLQENLGEMGFSLRE